MKPVIIFLGMSLLFLTLVSCNKDEDYNPSRNLIGTWKLTDIHANDGNHGVIVNGGGRFFTFNLHGQDYNTTTTFTENPNEFTKNGSYTTITIFDQTLPPDTTIVSAINSIGTWVIDVDTLTQIIAGDTSVVTILELSDSKLRISQDFVEEIFDGANGYGIYVYKSATVYSSFVKQ